MPVSKFAGRKLIGRSRPGNHVSCQCPWRPTKTEQCDVPRQLFFHAPNRFIDGRKSLVIEFVLELTQTIGAAKRIQSWSIGLRKRNTLAERMRNDQNIGK